MKNETAEKYYHFILNEEIAVGNELVKLYRARVLCSFFLIQKLIP